MNYISTIFVLLLLSQAISITTLIFSRFLDLRNETITIRVVYTTIVLSIVLTSILAFITPKNYVVHLAKWFGDEFYKYDLVFSIDFVAIIYSLFSMVLTGVIAVFSKRYLHKDIGFHRFYITLLFFMFGVTIVAFAGAIEIIIIGWEIIGLSSVLLISFFNYRDAPVKNSFWVFVNYRICDIGLFIAILLMHHFSHGSSFVNLESAMWMGVSSENLPPIIGFLILFAVIGKSALFPLSGWLPRAMEGPTPSSAIFYGAISIHLGALLLLRCSDLIAASSSLALTIVVIGIITALFGRLIGRAVNDIKGSLAYGSITQIGLIIAEIGMGFNILALLHIIGHSGFRTLQILRAPNLLHDRHQLEQMLGYHISLPVERMNKTYKKFDYFYYRILLERGFVDYFLKDIVIANILNVFRFVDKLIDVNINKKNSVLSESIYLFVLNLIAVFIPAITIATILELHINFITTVFTIAIFPIIGLFPFQNWYIKIFAQLSLKKISILILCQAFIIWLSHQFIEFGEIKLLHWGLTISAAISSFLAVCQTNVRRLLPYLIASQMAFLAFSSSSHSTTVAMGSNYMLLALIASCSFIMLIDALEKRQGMMTVVRPCGNYKSFPKLASFLLFFGLNASGFPLSVSYIAEDLILEGSFYYESIIDIIWIVSVALNNIVVIRLFLYLCNGTNNYEQGLDLKNTETFGYSAIMLFLFISLFIF